MKVYLASRFSTKEDIRKYAKELRDMGIEVTSRWLEEGADANSEMHDVTPEYLIKHAQIDLEDIDSSDKLVLFTIDPTTAAKRGGRHFESGYAYGIQQYLGGMELVTVGPRENIFHHLKDVRNFESWEAAKTYLKEVHDGESME